MRPEGSSAPSATVTRPGAVSLVGVAMEYRDRSGQARPVVEDVNLTIAPSEFVCIVGPSGCGKTTLIRIIQGLVTATAGEVLIDGQRLDQVKTDRGFVFQQDSLLPWRTVRANIAFPLELRKWDKAARHTRVQSLVELVGLSGYEDHYPHELSGGMRQRVNLARALAPNPQVLIMDEPFAALDALTREQMQAELLRIWSEERKTVVFVTHQIDEAVLLADRVVTMSARPGRIKCVTEIPIPRPRDLSTRHDLLFKEKVDFLWDILHEK